MRDAPPRWRIAADAPSGRPPMRPFMHRTRATTARARPARSCSTRRAPGAGPRRTAAVRPQLAGLRHAPARDRLRLLPGVRGQLRVVPQPKDRLHSQNHCGTVALPVEYSGLYSATRGHALRRHNLTSLPHRRRVAFVSLFIGPFPSKSRSTRVRGGQRRILGWTGRPNDR